MTAPSGATPEEGPQLDALVEAQQEVEERRERVLLHMPVDVRSASLVVIAVLASIFALRWAAAVFIPLMLSLILTYALAPLVGIITGLAFWAIGLENAAVWGIVAGVTNLIPYVGSVLVMGTSALVAFLLFNTIEMAVLVGGVSLLIHTLVGNLLTPWLTSRTSRMNPVAVFVGVIFWGWLWGVWGLLLGIPIMMIVKSVCDRVEDLQPIGELLGD